MYQTSKIWLESRMRINTSTINEIKYSLPRVIKRYHEYGSLPSWNAKFSKLADKQSCGNQLGESTPGSSKWSGWKGSKSTYQGIVFRRASDWWGNRRWSTKARQSTRCPHWLCFHLVIIIIIVVIISQIFQHTVAHLPLMPEGTDTYLTLVKCRWCTGLYKARCGSWHSTCPEFNAQRII